MYIMCDTMVPVPQCHVHGHWYHCYGYFMLSNTSKFKTPVYTHYVCILVHACTCNSDSYSGNQIKCLQLTCFSVMGRVHTYQTSLSNEPRDLRLTNTMSLHGNGRLLPWQPLGGWEGGREGEWVAKDDIDRNSDTETLWLRGSYDSGSGFPARN